MTKKGFLRIGHSVEPAHFQEQAVYFVENGYTTTDLYDLSLTITNNRELPRPLRKRLPHFA